MILIADIVLFFHFCIVIFITFGFVLVPIGYNLDWLWIKNKKLRLLHLGMMIFITFETLLGMACPCLLYTSPSPRDRQKSRMPSSA